MFSLLLLVVSWGRGYVGVLGMVRVTRIVGRENVAKRAPKPREPVSWKSRCRVEGTRLDRLRHVCLEPMPSFIVLAQM